MFLFVYFCRDILKSDLVRLSEIGPLESRLTYLIKDH